MKNFTKRCEILMWVYKIEDEVSSLGQTFKSNYPLVEVMRDEAIFGRK